MNLSCKLLGHSFPAVATPELYVGIGTIGIMVPRYRCERCGIEMLEAEGAAIDRLFRRGRRKSVDSGSAS